MKRYFVLLMAALMLLTLAACGRKQDEPQTVGGWTLTEDAAITPEARDAFEKAMEGLVGVNYTPAALLGTQLVSGTNYCFFCESVPVDGGESGYAFVTIYKDLDGNAQITDVAPFSAE